MKIAKEIALSNVKETQAKSKERFNKMSKEPTFDLHDRVLLRCSKVPTELSPKLFERYDGPFHITEIGPNYTYMFRGCSDQKPVKSPINATRLMHYKDPYIMRDLPDPEDAVKETVDPDVSIDQNPKPNHVNENNLMGNQTKEPDQSDAGTSSQGMSQEANPPSSQSDDTYYEVETLCKMEYIRGKKHYLVHWKRDYSDTWEPEDFITEKPKNDFHIRRAKHGKSGHKYFRF